MVGRKPWKRVGLAAGLTVLSAPLQAQGVLESMQTEVATIVRNAKGAIVSIEDRRLTPAQANGRKVSSDERTWFVPQATARRETNALQSQIEAAQLKINVARAQAAEAQSRLETARASKAEDAEAGAREKLQQAQAQMSVERIKLQAAQAEMDVAMAQRQGAVQFITPATPKTGSGFSIGDGYIVTTADVLEGMQNPVVVLDDGRRAQATLVGVDTEANIGLLRLPPQVPVPALKTGNSDAITPGFFAISIGNQSGQANSVALNLVAGIRNSGTYAGNHFYPSLIQIAGTVGAGASGAPVLNARGEVVGIMAAVFGYDTVESAYTVSPSISINKRLDSLRNPQFKLDYKYDANPQERLKLTPPKSRNVPRTGPALKGESRLTAPGESLKEQITIVDRPYVARTVAGGQLNGLNSSDVNVYVADAAVGQTLPPLSALPQASTLSIVRPPVSSAGYAISINAVQGILNDLRAGRKIVHGWIGITMGSTTKTTEENGLLTTRESVIVDVVLPNSPASKAGLQKGDILTEINGQKVEAGGDVRTQIVRLRPGDTVRLVILRNGNSQALSLSVEPRPAVMPTVLVAPGR